MFSTCDFQFVGTVNIRFDKFVETFCFFTDFPVFPLTSFANPCIVESEVRIVILS